MATWKVLKSMKAQNKDHASIQLIGMQEWVRHYQGLLAEDRTEFGTYNENIPLITPEEAPGSGSICVELIKAAPSKLFLIYWH